MTTISSSDLVGTPQWSIRAEQPIDLDQIDDLHRAAFGGQAEGELVDAIRSGPDFVPELSLVAAADDGSVLGHVLVSRIGFEPDGEGGAHIGALALAPIAVLPPHQGRGIGSALMHEALAIADAREEAFVAVLGSPAFYAQFGFVPASELQVRGPYDDAGPHFQIRTRRGATVQPGTVVYPAAFSAV